jgi:3-oxoacyl-[acyl-carrier-protein] synthase-1
MRAALRDANLGPGDIDYVNLHGTGTPLNDRMEALALQTVFGEEQPWASSTKPVTGHTLGAAGALELALCWMTLAKAVRRDEEAAVPVHCWDGEYDDAMPRLRLIEKGSGFPRGFVPRTCMSNSFAFGGCNVSLVIGRS